MRQEGIPVCKHRAEQMNRSDYSSYDLIIGMDRANYANILRITGSDPQDKVKLLLDFTDCPRDIADPWYTGNFDRTYDDVLKGCTALLEHLATSL